MDRCLSTIKLLVFFTVIILNIAFSQGFEKAQYHIGWRLPDSIEISRDEFIVDDSSKIYFFDKKSVLYCLDENNNINWTYRGAYKYAFSPFIFDDKVCFFASDKNRYTMNTEIQALDKSGNLKWKFKGEKRFIGSPYVLKNGDIILRAGENERFSTIDETGIYRISSNGEGKYIDIPDLEKYGVQGTYGDNQLITYKDLSDTITFISLDGKIDKTCYADNSSWKGLAQIINYGDLLFLITGSNKILALDNNCKNIWSHPIDGDVFDLLRSNVVISTSGILFTSTMSGKVYSFNSDSGLLNWMVNTDSVISSIGNIQLLKENDLLIKGGYSELAIMNESGNLEWHYQMNGPGGLGKSHVLSNGDFLVIQEGCLYKFTTDTTQIIPIEELAPLPGSKTEAEEEIVSSLLDYITNHKIGYLAELIETSDKPEGLPELTAPRENLIIYCRGKKDDKYDYYELNSSKPLKVWIFDGFKLIEKSSSEIAIKEYMNKNNTNSAIPWNYGRYEFGIFTISDDFTKADIQLDHHCGPLCGSGNHYVIHRSPSGKWWIVETLDGWIS